MVKWNSFKKKRKFNEDISLQITPMASVFTVILVFLFKSVSIGVSTVTPSQDLTLPEIKGAEAVFEGLRMEISSSAVLVDDKLALKMRDFEFNTADLAEDGSFKPLNAIIHQGKASGVLQEDDSKALIMADVKTPYSVLKRVLASAANKGYFDLKLVVIEER